MKTVIVASVGLAAGCNLALGLSDPTIVAGLELDATAGSDAFVGTDGGSVEPVLNAGVYADFLDQDERNGIVAGPIVFSPLSGASATSYTAYFVDDVDTPLQEIATVAPDATSIVIPPNTAVPFGAGLAVVGVRGGRKVSISRIAGRVDRVLAASALPPNPLVKSEVVASFAGSDPKAIVHLSPTFDAGVSELASVCSFNGTNCKASVYESLVPAGPVLVGLKKLQIQGTLTVDVCTVQSDNGLSCQPKVVPYPGLGATYGLIPPRFSRTGATMVLWTQKGLGSSVEDVRMLVCSGFAPAATPSCDFVPSPYNRTPPQAVTSGRFFVPYGAATGQVVEQCPGAVGGICPEVRSPPTDPSGSSSRSGFLVGMASCTTMGCVNSRLAAGPFSLSIPNGGRATVVEVPKGVVLTYLNERRELMLSQCDPTGVSCSTTLVAADGPALSYTVYDEEASRLYIVGRVESSKKVALWRCNLDRSQCLRTDIYTDSGTAVLGVLNAIPKHNGFPKGGLLHYFGRWMTTEFR